MGGGDVELMCVSGITSNERGRNLKPTKTVSDGLGLVDVIGHLADGRAWSKMCLTELNFGLVQNSFRGIKQKCRSPKRF